MLAEDPKFVAVDVEDNASGLGKTCGFLLVRVPSDFMSSSKMPQNINYSIEAMKVG